MPRDILVEGPEGSWFAKPTFKRTNRHNFATLNGAGIAPENLIRDGVRVTLIYADHAIDLPLVPLKKQAAIAGDEMGGGWRFCRRLCRRLCR